MTSRTTVTRVCVKNLPPSFTEEKLKSHLIQRSPSSYGLSLDSITDCKILKTCTGQSRKIAFVGWRDAEMAKQCVSYFHKSYINTSKLSVEYAFTKNNKAKAPAAVHEDGHARKPHERLQPKNNNHASAAFDDVAVTTKYRPWSKHSIGSSKYAKLHPPPPPQQQQHDSVLTEEMEATSHTGELKKLSTSRHASTTTTNDDDDNSDSKNQEQEEKRRTKQQQRLRNEFLAVMAPRTSSKKSKFWSNDNDNTSNVKNLSLMKKKEEKEKDDCQDCSILDDDDDKIDVPRQHNRRSSSSSSSSYTSTTSHQDSDFDCKCIQQNEQEEEGSGMCDNKNDNVNQLVVVLPNSTMKTTTPPLPATTNSITTAANIADKNTSNLSISNKTLSADMDYLKRKMKVSKRDLLLEEEEEDDDDNNNNSSASDSSSVVSSSTSEEDESVEEQIMNDKNKISNKLCLKNNPTENVTMVMIDQHLDSQNETRNHDGGALTTSATSTAAKVKNQPQLNNQANLISNNDHRGPEPEERPASSSFSQEQEQQQEEEYCPTRLFIRNLPYDTMEEDLLNYVSNCSRYADKFQQMVVTECHIPIDTTTKKNKGYAFVSFETKDAAILARSKMDGCDFQGRIIHVHPAKKKPLDENSNVSIEFGEEATYKNRRELERKQKAGDLTGWSATFVRGDTVVEGLADRLGISKDTILNAKEGSSGDTAVHLALAETQVLNENRDYFASHGIDLEALVTASVTGAKEKIGRSNVMILVKNLPYCTQEEELVKLFTLGVDSPKQVLLPPSKTIALIQFFHPVDAKKAFRKLAYRRFKHVPLYLEWAPLTAILTNNISKTMIASHTSDNVAGGSQQMSMGTSKDFVRGNVVDEKEIIGHSESGIPCSIYVKNLNFNTTEERLQRFVEKVVATTAVRIPTKIGPTHAENFTSAPKRESSNVSMGYGFIECGSASDAVKAIKALAGKYLDGHALELELSLQERSQLPRAKLDSHVDKKQKCKKLLVRNVPFEATRAEIARLFGSYGHLKKIRLPKKFDGSHRGFAFVEFLTAQEAQNAKTDLSRTHLYGRHLVLEWTEDNDDILVLREKAKRDLYHHSAGNSSTKVRKLL